jgi:flagellar hook assembly protein FlgD
MGSRCTISFAVPAEGPVRLGLHGVDGRHVRTLLDDSLPAGAHGVVWDGTDERGLPVAGGVYFARLTTNQGTRACRLIVVR